MANGDSVVKGVDEQGLRKGDGARFISLQCKIRFELTDSSFAYRCKDDA